MQGVQFELKGHKELIRKLRRYPMEAKRAAASSLYRSASRIMAISVERYVPVETGNLQGTARVDLPVIKGDDVSVTMGYGSTAIRYAVAVHENPRAGKTGGISPSGKRYRRWAQKGTWKYLEKPLKQEANSIVRHLVDDLNRIPEIL